jgi:putative hemolysin
MRDERHRRSGGSGGSGASAARVVTTLAQGPDDVAAAQRLRYRVFAEELGARLPSAVDGVDRDEFDVHCDHLILRDRLTNEVVGTYRILSDTAAARIGGFYSAGEFDLGGILALPRLVEVGRACVHPAYRTGTALALLLAGLARHIRAGGHEYVMGCASIPVGDDPGPAVALCRRLVREHASPPEWRVYPHHRFDVRTSDDGTDVPVPTLLRAYLRMGAYVCGDAAWDDAFRTADLLILLPMARLNERYTQRLLRAA